jgi:serine/threonine protein kinase
MNTPDPNDPDDLEDEFARLLERYEQARAAGQTPDPADDPSVPAALRTRLDNARACLGRLEALWPREPPSARDTATEDDSGPSTDFEVRQLPERVGRFRILEELGRGGMGVVYKAWQEELKRPVALKVISSGEFAGPQERSRFRTEAEAAARLQHPHIVQVHEVGEAGGHPYVCLEYVAGGNLARYLQGRPQPPPEAATLVEALARAMDHAHRRGVVHRDLKPSNILLGAPDAPAPPSEDLPPSELSTPHLALSAFVPKVTDFGLARMLDAEQTRTQEGVVLGTACYMAPEQAHGRVREVGPAADVYALGAILYELLTGRPPFRGETMHETLEQVRTQEPVPLRRLQAGVPRDLETVCLKCLDKDARRRYASAGALADDLGRWLRGEPVEARPLPWPARLSRRVRRHPLIACASVLLAGALLTVLLLPPDPAKEAQRAKAAQLRRLERQVAAGEPVELVGEVGMPWFRQVLGKMPVLAQPAPFSVFTNEVLLLDLLPDLPWDRYQFEAEFKAGQWESEKGFGLYVARQERLYEGKPEHWFLSLKYWETAEKEQRKQHVELTTDRYRDDNLLRLGRHYTRGPPLRKTVVKPSDVNWNSWHRLAVVVETEGVKAYWDSARLGEIAVARLTDLTNMLVSTDRPADFQPLEFWPRGALGLYIGRGNVEVRRAWVKPLP